MAKKRAPHSSPVSLAEIAACFLRVGTTGFGGPFAVVRLVEEEVVNRRKWLKSESVRTWVGACKLLPGPLATQVSIGVGIELGGILGGLVAGIAATLPAALLMGAIAWAYFGNASWTPGLRSQVDALWVLPVLAWAILPASALQILKGSREKWDTLAVGFVLGAIGAALDPRTEPVWLILSGMIAVARTRGLRIRARDMGSAVLVSLFLTHLFAGAATFGSGLAIIPLLKPHVVDHHHWVTERQFLDGVLFGQITPGPVVITAAFIGASAAGFLGACAASVGIFLPAFFNMLTWVPHVRARIDRSESAKQFISGLMPAVAGSLVGLSFHMREVLLAHGALGVGGAALLLAALIGTRLSAFVISLIACGLQLGLERIL